MRRKLEGKIIKFIVSNLLSLALSVEILEISTTTLDGKSIGNAMSNLMVLTNQLILFTSGALRKV